ncbi:MAG: C40 family peptidase [Pseudomonadota bacterium]
MLEQAAKADPRLLPARPDVAAAHLRETVTADRYADGVAMAVSVPVASLTMTADPGAGTATQLLFGERFTAYDTAADLAWGQAADGYVGYLPRACLVPADRRATHRVAALMTHVYPEPDIKRPPVGQLCFGALIAATAEDPRFVELADGGHVPAQHLVPREEPAADWVAEAERFLGAPYLWGGRSPAGLDCSALVQLALQAAGQHCPRDSDMQEAALGRDIDPDGALARGDIVFWRGHVGIMLGASRLLHANAHHMAVAVEPLARTRKRLLAGGDGPVTRAARLDAAMLTR